MIEKTATRIQTSVLNGLEKKVLVWLAERQPRWVNSDMLTLVGVFGSLMIAAGYILTDCNIAWIWLASAGFVVNWYGDSLDGTLARVRKVQRPVYGYYVDHTVDCINEFLMFAGIGISALMRFDLAMVLLIFYFLMTLNVSINAHLKGEFRLTYLKLGPTEFRLLVIIANTLLFFVKPLQEFQTSVNLFGREIVLRTLDIVGIVITVLLGLMYLTNIICDTIGYAKIDPPKKPEF